MNRDDISPDKALQILKEGNKRFFHNKLNNTDLPLQRKLTAEVQFPFATILGCIDSRAPSEYIFDMGIGDIINIRIAGNIVNEELLNEMIEKLPKLLDK